MDGTLDVIKNIDGRQEQKIAVKAPGGSIGEMAVIDGRSRSATVIALSDLDLIKITKQTFDKQLGLFPLWLQLIVKMTALRIRNVNDIVARNNIQDRELIKLLNTPYISDDQIQMAEEKFNVLENSMF